MPISQSVQNNFTKGLQTEFTGLNFPENAATDTENCVYSIIGDVTRRQGFNYEANFHLNSINRTSFAINTYKWNNVGGDGSTQIVVQQTGTTLYFYVSSAATIASPLSNQKLSSTVDVSSFVATGASFDSTLECQFSDGNGYLFVYHPNCDPFYCSYAAGTITATVINVNIRDFQGVLDSLAVNTRPSTLTAAHKYNLINQGWTAGSPWIATSSTFWNITVGSKAFTVAAGLLTPTVGDMVTISDVYYIGGPLVQFGSGNITGYTGTTLTVNITTVNKPSGVTGSTAPVIQPSNSGYITTWQSALANYPSNSDVWWYFKNSSDVFDPLTTVANVSYNSGNAPQGHFILSAFNQSRSTVSAVATLTDVVTLKRPRTGTWFQGRVWYTGVDDGATINGTSSGKTWTEDLYFSKIVQDPSDFGSCYQTNDPTSELLFDILPSDGGVAVIQGSGPIYKLFPIQNGMLIFAANGIWFLTGSQGIGFTATDYTLTKISSIQSISSTSFVDVNGLPYFWNEEGIYSVSPSQQGGLQVEPLTVGTILSFYNAIPRSAKSYVRGAYHPIDYVVQWVYKSTDYTSTTNRYDFDSILNFNTFSKAFYPYSLPAVTGKPHVLGINYVAGVGGSTSPDPVFKYLTAASDGAGSYNFTFSEERDTSYTDFVSYDAVGFNFTSYFVTGYRLAGKAILKFQPVYVYMYSNNIQPTQYRIQGLWDYANSGSSGKYSSLQKTIVNGIQYVGVQYRKHKIRGHGMALQLKVTSVDGHPFDIVGWSSWEMMNAGI